MRASSLHSIVINHCSITNIVYPICPIIYNLLLYPGCRWYDHWCACSDICGWLYEISAAAVKYVSSSIQAMGMIDNISMRECHFSNSFYFSGLSPILFHPRTERHTHDWLPHGPKPPFPILSHFPFIHQGPLICALLLTAN